jgi:hypothetical protein
VSQDPNATISPSELDDIARNLAATEELWESAQRETTVTITCPECGGAGNTDQGTLGSGCFLCSGTGTVVDEFAEAPLLELPGELRTLRLQYKGIRGLLDAHQSAVVARKNAVELNAEFPDEVPVPVPEVPPAPTVAQAAPLLAGMAKIDELKAAAKAVVQKQRKEQASLGAGEGNLVQSLKRKLAAANQKIRSLGKGKDQGDVEGGSLGGGLGADLEDDV